MRVRGIADGCLEREHEAPVRADFVDPAAVDLAHQHSSARRRGIAVDRRQVARGVMHAHSGVAVLANDAPVADEQDAAGARVGGRAGSVGQRVGASGPPGTICLARRAPACLARRELCSLEPPEVSATTSTTTIATRPPAAPARRCRRTLRWLAARRLARAMSIGLAAAASAPARRRGACLAGITPLESADENSLRLPA